MHAENAFQTVFLVYFYEWNYLHMCRNTPWATQGQAQSALLHAPRNKLADLDAQGLI
jgi:hypothetical protein